MISFLIFACGREPVVRPFPSGARAPSKDIIVRERSSNKLPASSSSLRSFSSRSSHRRCVQFLNGLREARSEGMGIVHRRNRSAPGGSDRRGTWGRRWRPALVDLRPARVPQLRQGSSCATPERDRWRRPMDRGADAKRTTASPGCGRRPQRRRGLGVAIPWPFCSQDGWPVVRQFTGAEIRDVVRIRRAVEAGEMTRPVCDGVVRAGRVAADPKPTDHLAVDAER
jgi:hypothetical protein